MRFLKTPGKLALAALALSAVMLTGATKVTAVGSVVAVTQNDLEDTKLDAYLNGSWFFYNDENDTIDNAIGSFVVGPNVAPFGHGSAQMSVSGTQRRNIATYRFKGTPLADITDLRFSTYNASAGNPGSTQRSGYLQFNVDFNGSDTWQRRLVYVPSRNGTVVQNTWQEWDALDGGDALWSYSGPTWPITGGAGSTAKTWSQILSDYPGVRVRMTDSFMGIRVGEPYADGYTENVDGFVFGTADGVTTFDFEPLIGPPADKNECKKGGWMQFNNPSFKNQGECVSYVVTQ